MKITAGETPFLLRHPDEVMLTIDEERVYLKRQKMDPDCVMILAFVDGKLAGNCCLDRRRKRKNYHRGSIGIALTREFWGLGIGTAMFQELISIGRKWGLMQLELEVFEGNDRAMMLYRKMGFEIVSYIPNAIRLEDGTLLKEYLMVMQL